MKRPFFLGSLIAGLLTAVSMGNPCFAIDDQSGWGMPDPEPVEKPDFNILGTDRTLKYREPSQNILPELGQGDAWEKVLIPRSKLLQHPDLVPPAYPSDAVPAFVPIDVPARDNEIKIVNLSGKTVSFLAGDPPEKVTLAGNHVATLDAAEGEEIVAQIQTGERGFSSHRLDSGKVYDLAFSSSDGWTFVAR